MSRTLPALTLLVLVSCQNQPPPEVCARDSGTPDTTATGTGTGATGTGTGITSTGTGTGATGTGTGSTSDAVLDPGPVVTCADPTIRDAEGFYHLKKTTFPGTLEGRYLWGGGAVVEDFDADGDLDMLLVGGDTLQLWSNGGDETFEDVAATALPATPWSKAVGGAAADYDADGDLDVVITQWDAPPVLLRNRGNGTFEDVTSSAGLGLHAFKSQSATWGDIDGDGDLDLFMGSYGEFTVIDVNEPAALCDDHVADPSELFENNGDGTFTDISERLPDPLLVSGDGDHLGKGGYVFASGFYDIDDDGCPELFTAHDDGGCEQSVLVDNDCSTDRWVVDSGSAYHPEGHDMGMGVADLNGDELPDFLLTSWKIANYVLSVRREGGLNDAYYATLNGMFPLATGAPDFQVFGWGTELADLDNDADIDGIMLFGDWDTYDPPELERDGVWVNDGGSYTDRAAEPAWNMADPGVGRGVVLADINGDGYLDVIKRQLLDDTLLYLSNCGNERWVKVALHMPGHNRRAIGAKVRITIDGQSQIRWVHSGSSGLYTGQPLEVHFGLGNAERIDQLDVIWPDTQVSTFTDVAVNRTLNITRR